MRYAIAPMLLAGALALAGCGGDGSSSGTTTAAEATTAPATTAPATTAPTTTAPPPTTTATTTATTPAKPKALAIQIRVQGGKPVGGIERVSAKKGQSVVVVVRSDVAEEVHIHGYDLMKDVEEGGTARIAFKANITGVFEIELEHSKVQIAELSVR
jgi:hypothetical protein